MLSENIPTRYAKCQARRRRVPLLQSCREAAEDRTQNPSAATPADHCCRPVRLKSNPRGCFLTRFHSNDALLLAPAVPRRAADGAEAASDGARLTDPSTAVTDSLTPELSRRPPTELLRLLPSSRRYLVTPRCDPRNNHFSPLAPDQ